MVQGRGEKFQATNEYHNPVLGVKILLGTLEKPYPVHSKTQQQTTSCIKHVTFLRNCEQHIQGQHLV